MTMNIVRDVQSLIKKTLAQHSNVIDNEVSDALKQINLTVDMESVHKLFRLCNEFLSLRSSIEDERRLLKEIEVCAREARKSYRKLMESCNLSMGFINQARIFAVCQVKNAQKDYAGWFSMHRSRAELNKLERAFVSLENAINEINQQIKHVQHHAERNGVDLVGEIQSFVTTLDTFLNIGRTMHWLRDSAALYRKLAKFRETYAFQYRDAASASRYQQVNQEEIARKYHWLWSRSQVHFNEHSKDVAQQVINRFTNALDRDSSLHSQETITNLKIIQSSFRPQFSTIVRELDSTLQEASDLHQGVCHKIQKWCEVISGDLVGILDGNAAAAEKRIKKMKIIFEEGQSCLCGAIKDSEECLYHLNVAAAFTTALLSFGEESFRARVSNVSNLDAKQLQQVNDGFYLLREVSIAKKLIHEACTLVKMECEFYTQMLNTTLTRQNATQLREKAQGYLALFDVQKFKNPESTTNPKQQSADSQSKNINQQSNQSLKGGVMNEFKNDSSDVQASDAPSIGSPLEVIQQSSDALSDVQNNPLVPEALADEFPNLWSEITPTEQAKVGIDEVIRCFSQAMKAGGSLYCEETISNLMNIQSIFCPEFSFALGEFDTSLRRAANDHQRACSEVQTWCKFMIKVLEKLRDDDDIVMSRNVREIHAALEEEKKRLIDAEAMFNACSKKLEESHGFAGALLSLLKFKDPRVFNSSYVNQNQVTRMRNDLNKAEREIDIAKKLIDKARGIVQTEIDHVQGFRNSSIWLKLNIRTRETATQLLDATTNYVNRFDEVFHP